MKRIPFQGPRWWRLTFLYTFLLGSICMLSADKQFIKNFFVQKKTFWRRKSAGGVLRDIIQERNFVEYQQVLFWGGDT